MEELLGAGPGLSQLPLPGITAGRKRQGKREREVEGAVVLKPR